MAGDALRRQGRGDPFGKWFGEQCGVLRGVTGAGRNRSKGNGDERDRAGPNWDSVQNVRHRCASFLVYLLRIARAPIVIPMVRAVKVWRGN